MPKLDEERIKKLQAAQNSLQMRLNSLSELPKASEDDPSYILTNHKLTKVNKILQDHYDSTRPVDDAGKLTEDAQSTLPIRSSAAEKPKQGASFVEAIGNNYFYEPSVEEVQHRVRNDPSLVDRLDKARPDLGIRKELAMAQPTRQSFNIGPMDPATGSTVHVGVQPAKMGIDAITSRSSTYKAVADDMWDERLRDAEEKGIGLSRYRDVELGDDPIDYLKGGLNKLLSRGIEPASVGASDTLSMGTLHGRPRAADELAYRAIESVGGPDLRESPLQSTVDTDEIERRNPMLANIARVGTYFMPQQPVNAMTTAGLEAAGYGAMKFWPRVGANAVAGGGGNALENLFRNVSSGKSIAEAGNEVPGDLLWGGAMGTAADAILANPARQLRQNTRESVTDPDLRALRNARGDTAVFGDRFSGYVAPVQMQEDLKTAGLFRHPGQAGDIAAERVAKPIQESLDRQLADETAKQAAQNKEYFRHPEYSAIEEPSQEAVDAVMELAEAGWITGAIDKKPTNVDADTIARVGDAVGRIAQAKPFVNLKQAQAYAQKTGGKVVDGYTAKLMFPHENLVGRNYAVVVASPISAEALTTLERSIDDVLKMSNKKGMENEPVYGRFQEAIKPVRDRFNLYVDAEGNLVGPPGGQAQGQGQPMAPTVAPRARRAAKPAPGASQRPQQQVPPPHEQLQEGQVSGVASTEPGTAPDPTQPDVLTPKVDPSTLAPEDVRLDPSTIAPGDVKSIPPALQGPPSSPRFFTFTPERIQEKWGLSPEEAQRVADNLNGRNAATVEIGSEDARMLPPDTDPEFTPREPSALEWSDVEPLPSSIPSEDVRALPPETERSIAPEPGYPTPNIKEWEASGNDAENWFEGIVRPGAPARSAEAQRIADLVEQQRAAAQSEAPKPSADEAAQRAAHWIDAAFAGGERPSDSTRAEMIAKSVAHQIGRALTSEEAKNIAKFVVPMTAGSALGDAIDDESGGAAGAAVGGLFSGVIRGKPIGPYPHQPEATLRGGKKVTGFSALRNQQHEAIGGLEEAGAGLGADKEKNVLRKVLNFNQYAGQPEDKLLLKEAEKLGLTEELWRAAATMAYGRLRGQGHGGKVVGNDRSILARILGPRIDAFAGMLAGEPTTYAGKQGLTEQGAREFFNVSGGRFGGRFGNDTNFIRDYLDQYLFGERPEEERRNAASQSAR